VGRSITMAQPFTDFPKRFNTSKIEKQGWVLFGEQKFPNYKPFWHSFVEPRLKHSWYLACLPDTPVEERRIIRLNRSIFNQFYHVYTYINSDDTDEVEGHAKRDFRVSLWRLADICDKLELLLLVVLVMTHNPDEHPVYQDYVRRIAERQAKIEEERVANRGRSFRLTEIPESPPPVAILPSELMAVQDKFNLKAYLPIAERVRHYDAALDVLPSLDATWLPRHAEVLDEATRMRVDEEDRAIELADEPALQKIVGDYASMRDLVQDQVDPLITEVNRIWGEQVLPLIYQYTDTPREKKTS
jgi:hypothetical protein